MSAVVEFVGDVLGGVADVVGSVVETAVDVVKDVASAVDDYVIQPILDDPLTAIATAAGAYFLGPLAVSNLGVSSAVGAGVGAAAGNFTAGMAQGEEFDEALKGAAVAGVTVGLTKGALDSFGPGSEVVGPGEVGVDIDAFGNAIDPFANPYATPITPDIVPTTAPSVGDFAFGTGYGGSEVGVDIDAFGNPIDPLANPYAAPLPAPAPAPVTTAAPTTNYLLDGVTFPDAQGIQYTPFTPESEIPRGLTGGVNYPELLTQGQDLGGVTGLSATGPTNIYSPYGEFGTGLQVGVPEVEPYFKPAVTIDPISGVEIVDKSIDSTGLGSQVGGKGGFGEALRGTGELSKALGSSALDFAIENPFTTLIGADLLTGGSILGLDKMLGGPPDMGGMPGGAGGAGRIPRLPGETDEEYAKRVAQFTDRLKQYAYNRSRTDNIDEIEKYGRGPQARFFTDVSYTPIEPIEPIESAAGGQIRSPLNQQMEPVQRPNPDFDYYRYGSVPMAVGGRAIRSPLAIGGMADGRTDDVPAVLSDGEYVIDAETVALLGNGSTEAGAAQLDRMREEIRKHKGKALARGKISPDAMGALSYLKG
jgi:hypothetical protein